MVVHTISYPMTTKRLNISLSKQSVKKPYCAIYPEWSTILVVSIILLILLHLSILRNQEPVIRVIVIKNFQSNPFHVLEKHRCIIVGCTTGTVFKRMPFVNMVEQQVPWGHKRSYCAQSGQVRCSMRFSLHISKNIMILLTEVRRIYHERLEIYFHLKLYGRWWTLNAEVLPCAAFLLIENHHILSLHQMSRWQKYTSNMQSLCEFF